MSDIDMIFDILRETWMPNTYWVKPMSYYNMSNIQNYLILLNTFTIYGLTIILYGKYLVPFVADISVVSEIIDPIANMDINKVIGLFHENADKIILQNNKELFLISHKVMDSFLSSSGVSNAVSVSQVADLYGHQIFLAIKSDPILYSKLMQNDVLVKYISDVIKQGFLNKDIPESLGLKL